LSKAVDSRVIIGVAAAFILWYFVFLTDLLVSFWYRVTLASIALALYAYLGSSRLPIPKPNQNEIVQGIASGILLYALFYVGFNIFRPLVEGGALNVYTIREETSLMLPAMFLLVTSFCEEYFWRGFTQRNIVASWGRNGVIVASLLYAAIHIPTLNMPLTAAALIAGLFWGILYEYTGSIWLVTFSHIVWTEMIFVFLPLK